MSVDESRVRELKSALQEKIQANAAIGESFRIEDGRVIVTEEQKSAFQKNLTDIREIKGLISGLQEMGGYESENNTPAGPSVAAIAAAAASGGYSAKSLGDLVLESAEFKSLAGGRNGVTMATPIEVKQADIGSMWAGQSQKDVYTAMPGGTPTAFGRTERDPLIPMQRRTQRVRDLFPARSTNATIIEYFRQTGFTNAASTVAERNSGNTAFGLKPQSGLSFTGMQAPVRTIAHWEAAHRNALADEPQLRAIIDNELLYGLRLAEDAQILEGDGVGENLLGIMNSGIQTYDWSDGADTPVPDTKADAIRRAATLAYLSFYQPTGVVLHPNDYEDIELTKNTQGTYLFAVSIQDGGQARLWRMPVVETPAMTEGHALVGAFGTGAQIYDREQANIRVSESHADFFIRNAIVILAEERLALAVKRPEAFVDVTFDAAPS